MNQQLRYALLAALITTSPSLAQDKAAEAAKANDSEKVDIQKVQEKYWARGNESELGVVQNRQFSKAKKFELMAFGGITVTDPFISVKTLGGSFGFHFNEYLSLHAIGWRSYTSMSESRRVLEASGKRANTNDPSAFYGGELRGSLLYGKLSLVGAAIIYYDMRLIAGAGTTQTETGSYFTPHAGLGQQFFLSQYFTLNLDYRIMRYTEQTKEKEITARLGQLNPPRTNWSHNIAIGLGFQFGGK